MPVPADRESRRSKITDSCCCELSDCWCQVQALYRLQARQGAMAAACVHAQAFVQASCFSSCQNETQVQVKYS